MKKEVKQFNILEIILYHLLPALPILFIVIVFSNPVWGLGFPIFLSLMFGIILGLIPIQLGILFVIAKKQNKTIKDLILFREKMPLRKLILLAIPCFIFALIIFMTVASIEHPLWGIFNWIPDWFRINRFSPGDTSKGILIVTVILNFIFNGILGPVVEEIYFRGFLLPRMKRLGRFAPITNVILFSLYHLFTPWENVTRIIALAPYIHLVWYKKNIYIGIIVHCAMNTFSAIGMLSLLLS